MPALPDEISNAQSSLLRLSRRHSLPANAATSISGLLGFLGGDAPRAQTVPPPPQTAHTPPVNRPAGNPVNRHRYGHRHTRSEAYDRPVIVKNYNPPPAMPSTHAIEEEEEDVRLPSVDEFSFEGILKAVDPQANAALESMTELCVKYQDSVRHEVDGLTDTQSKLHSRMLETDQLATQVLKSTKSRTDQLSTESAGFRNGTAVESLAEATEATYTAMTSIVSTLLAIDEMLEPQDRLSTDSSAHKNHYPQLHTLLVGKATELNLCFNGKRTPAGPSDDLPMRRRMSSSSQVLLSSGMGSTSSRSRPPPQLMLKTILPSVDTDSDAQGSYFPLAPQTATGISLTHSTGNSSSSSVAVQNKRSSGFWGSRPNTATFFPIREGENGSTTSIAPTTNQWRRSSGNWSAVGGWFTGRSSKGSSGDSVARRERAEDRLKRVLSATDAKGKGKRVTTSRW